MSTAFTPIQHTAVNASPHSFKPVSTYNMACVVMYAAFRLMQKVTVVGEKLPGMERLNSYLLGKCQEAAIENLINWGIHKIMKTDSQDAIGDFVKNVQVGAVNLGENWLLQQAGNIAGGAAQNVLFQGIENVASSQSLDVATNRAREMAKMPLKLAVAYVLAYREEAWNDFDELLGLDKRLSKWHISSEHIWGGDYLKSGIKGALRFLVDILLVDRYKDESRQYVSLVRNVKEGIRGGGYLADIFGIDSQKIRLALGAAGLSANYLTYMGAPMPLRLLTLGASWMGNDQQKGMMAASNMAYWSYQGLSTVCGVANTGLWLGNALCGGLGAGGIAIAGGAGVPLVLLYMRQYHPDKWEALCQQMPDVRAFVDELVAYRPELLTADFLERRGLVARDDFNPDRELSVLYGFEDHAALAQSRQLILEQTDFERIKAQSMMRLEVFYAELAEVKAQGSQAIGSSDPFAELNDNIAVEIKAIEAADVRLDAIKIEHTALMDRSLDVKLALLEQNKSMKSTQAILSGLKHGLMEAFDAELSGGVDLALDLKNEMDDIREQLVKLQAEDPQSAEIKPLKQSLTLLQNKFEEVEVKIRAKFLTFLDSVYDSEDLGDLEVKKMREGQLSDALKNAALDILRTQDDLVGGLLDVDVRFGALKALCAVYDDIKSERAVILKARLEQAEANRDQAVQFFKDTQAQYALDLKSRAMGLLNDLPEISENTNPRELLDQLLRVAVLYQKGYVETDNIEGTLGELKNAIDGIGQQFPQLSAELDEIKNKFHYQRLFPLKTDRTHVYVEEKQDDQGQLVLEADIKAFALDSVERDDKGAITGIHVLDNFALEDVARIQNSILREFGYKQPAALSGIWDPSFIDQADELSIYINPGSEPISVEASQQAVVDAIGSNLDIMGVGAVIHAPSTASLTTSRLLNATIPLNPNSLQVVNEGLASRMSQFLNRDFLTYVASVRQAFKEHNGVSFIPYRGAFYQIQQREPTTHAFEIRTLPDGDVRLSVITKWEILGHKQSEDGPVFNLEGDEPSYFESCFNFHFKPGHIPVEQFLKKTEAASGGWGWGRIMSMFSNNKMEINPDFYKKQDGNIIIAAEPPFFALNLHDKVVHPI